MCVCWGSGRHLHYYIYIHACITNNIILHIASTTTTRVMFRSSSLFLCLCSCLSSPFFSLNNIYLHGHALIHASLLLLLWLVWIEKGQEEEETVGLHLFHARLVPVNSCVWLHLSDLPQLGPSQAVGSMAAVPPPFGWPSCPSCLFFLAAFWQLCILLPNIVCQPAVRRLKTCLHLPIYL